MNQQLATTSDQVTSPVLHSFLDAMGLTKKLNEGEKTQFLQIALAYGLNPFKREIYCTKYGEGYNAQFSIVVGYEVYLKRAERTGKLDGFSCEFAGSGDDLECTVLVWRKDWNRPLQHTAYYSEAVQTTKEGRPNRFWAKMPKTMLRKTTLSQAFRLAFPDDLGGMPYTNDELGVEVQDVPYDVVDETKRQSYESHQAHEERVKMTKKEAADAMKAQQLADEQRAVAQKAAVMGWQARCQAATTPDEFAALRNEFGKDGHEVLKTLKSEDKKYYLTQMMQEAAERCGIDYDLDSKTFFYRETAEADSVPLAEAQEVI